MSSPDLLALIDAQERAALRRLEAAASDGPADAAKIAASIAHLRRRIARRWSGNAFGRERPQRLVITIAPRDASDAARIVAQVGGLLERGLP